MSKISLSRQTREYITFLSKNLRKFTIFYFQRKIKTMSEDITVSNKFSQATKHETEQKEFSVIKADPSRKRVTGRRRATNRVPDEILNNKDLAADMAVLPSNYNFEVGLIICHNNNV